MQRIVIIGTTGSGKTTLGQRLAGVLEIPVMDLDALYWQDDWVLLSDEVAEQRMRDFAKAPAWIISGNFRRSRQITWQHADTLIWLDYPFLTLFSRLLRRSVQRITSKQALWGTNNRESWRRLFSRESIVLWLFQSYWRRRREIPGQVAEYPALQVIHHRHPRQTEQFLSDLAAKIRAS